MDWTESLENIWEEIKDRSYYIAGVGILVMIPFLLGIEGYQTIPILGDIYAIGRSVHLFPSNILFLMFLSLSLIWAIFAASWDFLSGYTGQVSFGHAIFWGISAYFSYWFGSRSSFLIDILGPIIPFDPIIAIILAALVSTLLAVLI
ncbi:MAG: ABC transporter permease subunit, partial [Candidatus Hodarchaeales archaeon]